MSNHLPQQWSKRSFNKLFHIAIGGTPSRNEPLYWDNQHITNNIWVSIRDLKGRVITKTSEKLSDLGIEKSNAKLVAKGTVIMSFKLSVGKTAIAGCDLYTNEAIAAFTPLHPDIIDTSYFYHGLHHWDLLQDIDQAVKGVTLNKEKLRNIDALLPPLPEQQKIAAILTSVDDVIEKTQAQIDKLKDLKTAMMQELLSPQEGRSLDVNGKPFTAFKDSPLGRIPVEWETSNLDDLSSFITSGSRGWAQYYSEAGAIFIRIGNLTREHINFRFKDIVYVTPPSSSEGKRTLVQTGDVLISITADLGVIAVVNDDINEAYVNQHVSLVRPKDINKSRWLGHYLAFENTQQQFTANNDSGAKAGLNLTAIRNVKVVIPPPKDLKQIVDALDSIDVSIAIKRKKLTALSDTKKALMQDLLTGKVRVNVNN